MTHYLTIGVLFIIFRAITIDMNNPFVTNGYVSARYFCDRE